MMKNFIKMLEERGIISRLKLVISLITPPKDLSAEEIKLIQVFAACDCVKMEMNRDAELRTAFGKACYKLGEKALIKELENILEGN